MRASTGSQCDHIVILDGHRMGLQFDSYFIWNISSFFGNFWGRREYA